MPNPDETRMAAVLRRLVIASEQPGFDEQIFTPLANEYREAADGLPVDEILHQYSPVEVRGRRERQREFLATRGKAI